MFIEYDVGFPWQKPHRVLLIGQGTRRRGLRHILPGCSGILDKTTLTARAEAFLIEMAWIGWVRYSFIAATDIESPGLIGYSTPLRFEVYALRNPARVIDQNVHRFHGGLE